MQCRNNAVANLLRCSVNSDSRRCLENGFQPPPASTPCRAVRDKNSSKLSETAPTWGKLVAPWAEYVVHSLWSGRASQARSVRTPLTQSHRREAKCGPVPKLKMPKTEHVCRGCGNPIKKGHQDCGVCAVSSATTRRRLLNGRPHRPMGRHGGSASHCGGCFRLGKEAAILKAE
jgi:hypothetical protein